MSILKNIKAKLEEKWSNDDFRYKTKSCAYVVGTGALLVLLGYTLGNNEAFCKIARVQSIARELDHSVPCKLTFRKTGQVIPMYILPNDGEEFKAAWIEISKIANKKSAL